MVVVVDVDVVVVSAATAMVVEVVVVVSSALDPQAAKTRDSEMSSGILRFIW